MDLQKMGTFLAQLRKERGLTQEQLGEKIGVSNKTVSRWEKGNYLPPVEMLQSLSAFYGVSVNELLSGQRLTEGQYRQKAEENIATALQENHFSRRDRLREAGIWLRKNWWLAAVCFAPMLVILALRPFLIGDMGAVAGMTVSLMVFGLSLVCSHLVCHVSEKACAVTGQPEEFRAFRMMRVVWLIVLAVMAFICTDLLLATIHSLTPAGTADGYLIRSMFYDVLIRDEGIYPDNCFNALESALKQLFLIFIINLDLTVLWMRRK